MTRRAFALGSLALTVALGCSRSGATGTPAREARRIVSLSPATTEALYAVGAGDRVIGRSRFCDFPPEVAKIPVVGGFVDADLEAILDLQADLVVGARTPASEALGEKLERRGVSTWFPVTDSLASIDAMILGLGARTGRQSEASRVAADLDAREGDVERSVTKEGIPRVLLVLDVSPVVAAGPKSFADELLTRARGTNVVVDGAPWQTVGFERVVELDPDFVLDASAPRGAGPTRITPQAPGWAGVRAVREGRVVLLDDERVQRPGPRVAEGLAIVARAIHPGAAVPTW